MLRAAFVAALLLLPTAAAARQSGVSAFSGLTVVADPHVRALGVDVFGYAALDYVRSYGTDNVLLNDLTFWRVTARVPIGA